MVSLFLMDFSSLTYRSVHTKVLSIYPSTSSHVKFRHAHHQDTKVLEFAPLCVPSEIYTLSNTSQWTENVILGAGPSDPALALRQKLFTVEVKAPPTLVTSAGNHTMISSFPR